jgi:hypothetical protein
VDTLRSVGLGKETQYLLVKAAEESGFDPHEFDWDDGADESRISHLRSQAYFVVGGSPGQYTVRRLAGDHPVEERDGLSWYRTLEQFKLWLGEVKRDIEIPDLWAELKREKALLRAGAEEALDNTPFTPAEREEIAGRLRELGEYAKSTYSLSPPQMKAVDAKLDYLIEAAESQGRRDWLILFYGVVFGWILSAALPPEAGRDILVMFLNSLGGLFGNGILGLPRG